MTPRNILCVPLDPVHDAGIKIVRNALARRGHVTTLLSPDLSTEEVVRLAARGAYDDILVSRTLGYGVAELLGRFIDLLDAAGVRNRSRVVLGGKAITPELAAELGFDKGFDEHSLIEEIVAFVEGEGRRPAPEGVERRKPDITAPYTYQWRNDLVAGYLDEIVGKLLRWADGKTTDGVRRARVREQLLGSDDPAERERLKGEYGGLCDPIIAEALRGDGLPKGVRVLTQGELDALRRGLAVRRPVRPQSIRHGGDKPLLFKFLGSGCPVMDLVHAKVCERWGIDGFLLINPSWEARYEGLLDGVLAHRQDGTITSYQNIRLIREHLERATLLTVRAHRGLNTPETVLLAGAAGADMTKIDLVYGSLGAGTDPERLSVDAVEAIRIAARYGLPFDIPGNDELSGVPAWKTLAGLLINVRLGRELGARPILKPLFCYGPHIVINGLMDKNFVDYNVAKVGVLRSLVDCPVWPGEPIAFMTQTEDRVQSATATSAHAALALSLGVDAITVASTDEAYSRGPIALASRLDCIQTIREAYRFLGDATIQPTPEAERFREDMTAGIIATLDAVRQADHLPAAIQAGLLGTTEDGAYPGTFGRGTVRTG